MEKIVANNEELVLNTINEYLNKNRFFRADEIISFISSRFTKSRINININGIRAILKSLIEKNIIVEGSKLTRDDVLSNSNRKRIFGYIQNNPGMHFNRIVSDLNLNIPVVEWHLNMLIKFNYIHKEKFNNLVAYFDINVKSEDRLTIHLISKDKSKQIINFLKENQEGITKNTISKKLKMHATTITKNIDKLIELGILTKKSLSNKTLYFLDYENYMRISNKFGI
ncbi:MAG: winged helix-turn-helix transcriptional regulator [Promethearchaeota archaeon]|jgi:predicted transcriptional regulator